MSRPLRIEQVGGWYHVTARGNERQPLFRDPRDRDGDEGRDLVLYVGRRACGLKLRELAAAAGMTDDSAVSLAIRRFEQRRQRSKSGREQLKQVCQLSNVEM